MNQSLICLLKKAELLKVGTSFCPYMNFKTLLIQSKTFAYSMENDWKYLENIEF